MKWNVNFFRKKKYLKVFFQYFNLSFNQISMRVTHDHMLEFIWTVLPSIVLFFLAYPSLVFLSYSDSYLQNEEYFITIRIIGNQWFWSYEYDFINNLFEIENISFDSYMIPESDLLDHQLRLLETDSILLLPQHVPVRILVTSSDVLHSWAVPSLGVKIDACPGRMNQVFFSILRPGEFFGQCSEICGVNHGFMPINLVSVIPSEFNLFNPLLK